MRLALGVLATLPACAFGASPIVGWGEHGLVAGGEVSGGVAYFQTSVGFDRFYEHWIRLDVGFDNVAQSGDSKGVFGGGRIGAGYVGGEAVDTHFTVVGGPGAIFVWKNPTCSKNATSAAAEIQIRYVDGWELDFVPRIDVFDDRCFD